MEVLYQLSYPGGSAPILLRPRSVVSPGPSARLRHPTASPHDRAQHPPVFEAKGGSGEVKRDAGEPLWRRAVGIEEAAALALELEGALQGEVETRDVAPFCSDL